jgi:general secretion pathway protein G
VKAFTYLELVIAMGILGILAAAAAPTARVVAKRSKEVELKRALLEMRTAIDRFKVMADKGEIELNDISQLGYPADLDQLVNGVSLKKHPGQHFRFLRRIPRDPMTGEDRWGMRSVQDDHDARAWGRENVFDVYSLSDGTALDGTEYSSW